MNNAWTIRRLVGGSFGQTNKRFIVIYDRLTEFYSKMTSLASSTVQVSKCSHFFTEIPYKLSDEIQMNDKKKIHDTIKRFNVDLSGCVNIR